MDLVDANDESKSRLEDIVWFRQAEKYEYGGNGENYQKILNNTSNREVEYVMILTVMENDFSDADKLIIVGVVNGQFYSKWSDSGKFPYSRYCSDDKPGKLRTDVIYGYEYYQTLSLLVASKNGESVSVNVYTKNSLPQNVDIPINGMKFKSLSAREAFAVTKPIYNFPNLSDYSNMDFIVDVDLLLDGSDMYGVNNRFILDGGNLYRWYNIFALPPRLICDNGHVICKNAEAIKGVIRSGARNGIFKNVTIGSNLTPKGHQGLYSYEINVLDFINVDNDYNAIASSASINANKVLKRIFDAVYEYGEPNGNRFVIRFPENQYGQASYFLTETLVIPQGVIVDFGGARLFVEDAGDQDDHRDKYFKSDKTKSVISFGYNPVYPILVTGQIRNVEIRLLNITRDAVEKVIDLTYFSGVLENVRINLGGVMDIVALWQPYGTPIITYSDMKIIRRCIIENFGWRVDTPTVIFCLGDGCIIEQSILGFAAIIGGNSYTIRGCLNDKFLICDSSVDFTASYWEAGQFEILNSEVSFGCGRLHASNALNGAANQNKYLGPWFSIDTNESYDRLRKIITNHHLNVENFAEPLQNTTNKHAIKARAYERPSTVEFKPTMKVQTEFWGYRQPWSGPLFKFEGHPRIIGLENVANVDEVFLNNSEVPLPGNNQIGQLAALSVSIPLVNGDFYDWRTSIRIPDSVAIVASKYNELNVGETRRLGLDWEDGTVFTDIKVVFEIDRKRKLYSPIYEYGSNIEVGPGDQPVVGVYVTYQNDEDAPRNLKTMLLFRCQNETGERLYMARNHFKEVSHASIVNVGDRDVQLRPDKMLDVGQFSFIRNIGFASTDSIAGLEKTTPELVEYFKIPDTTCMSGEDMDVPDCDGLCYGHACMCDNKGNLVPEVKECVFAYHGAENYNECSRMELTGGVNVRAYVDDVPVTGEWADGDEVVIDSLQAVYRYYGDTWHQII